MSSSTALRTVEDNDDDDADYSGPAVASCMDNTNYRMTEMKLSATVAVLSTVSSTLSIHGTLLLPQLARLHCA
jgi:hypothetical protein